MTLLKSVHYLNVAVPPGCPVYPEVGLELVEYVGGDVLAIVKVLVATPALVGRQLNNY